MKEKHQYFFQSANLALTKSEYFIFGVFFSGIFGMNTISDFLVSFISTKNKITLREKMFYLSLKVTFAQDKFWQSDDWRHRHHQPVTAQL